MHVDTAILSRKSVRRFLSQQVPRSVIEHILYLAARAPSGSNTQPWHVHVVSGQVRDSICNDILASLKTEPDQPGYSYYPDPWFEPYLTRRRANGFSLYEKLGIAREDHAARERQHLRNYRFFDAPAGLFISLDQRLNTGSYLDLGMFIQNILLAARGQGLHTCTQVAFAGHHRVIRRHIPLAEEDILVCGIALGYEDRDAPENQLETSREPVSEFATFQGFREEETTGKR